MTHLALTLLLLNASPLPASATLFAVDDADAVAPAPKWPGVALLGAGGGALAVGGLFVLAGLYTFDGLHPLPCGSTFCATRADDYRNAAFAAGIGLTAVVGGILWLIWSRVATAAPEPQL